MFYDPPLADCILENLKCPLLFVYNVLELSLSLSLSPGFAGLEMAIVGGKRRGTMEYQRDSAPLSAPGVSVYPRIERKWRGSRLTFIYLSPSLSISVNQTLKQAPTDNWTRRNGNWRIITSQISRTKNYPSLETRLLITLIFTISFRFVYTFVSIKNKKNEQTKETRILIQEYTKL